ncbi:16S rRNA (uracil(1498)-N(3))-methyltransferase [Aequorivita antarctica]|uniref:Ribosomal RNA small subunit methyltransferase E n=1 Tax=Aequorivita antarctica TaxID=153266 RepID=A0A5C6Z3Y0_9FLAO|nr:16S rRNA (uracil(1498)-N(3))-methyltransferase [Aequorivita antarctica]TXD74378.1 16S rRNA (uracil(1498)-N(3))-methyltransferase [Aequorivita antarctica]SRX73732.1 Ribosomal RNA small subunit methyltransferase E [Aequorivita antarctica]
MQLFYTPNISENSKEITFDKEESRHIVKVLRMKEGDSFKITNGKGSFFDAEVISANPKGCLVKIISEEVQQPLSYQLHIAVAPTKLNDRYEWFMEKATEIGISEITPIICDHSERKVIKSERYEKILQSAMKQSLKAYLPILNEAVSFKNFVTSEKTTESLKCIAHCEETDKKSLKSVLIPKKKVIILIGPEGDFSNEEIEFAKTSGFIPVTLGESRLRTETAAIVACHSVAFINE